MGRKVFTSYKYNDPNCNTINYRKKIIKCLKQCGNIYNGEDHHTKKIKAKNPKKFKKHISKMIFDTTITIVLISPIIKSSLYVEWEIHYSLKDIERDNGDISSMNGVIAVILPDAKSSYKYALRDGKIKYTTK